MAPQNNLFATSIAVQEHLKSFHQLRKHLPGQKLSIFALDLTLVAYSVRTGYLVDLFSPRDPVDLFSELLNQLRAITNIGHKFLSVIHVHEPSSGQSFFLNKTLLTQKVNSYTDIAFIHLRNPIKILENPPEDVLKIIEMLDRLKQAPESLVSFSLPVDSPVEALVPLAAILLDYPAAYVPPASHDNVLAGVPLDFYECLLTLPRGEEKNVHAGDTTYTIMKFSCPTILKEDLQKSQGDEMEKMLMQMFLGRLETIGESALRVKVEHSTQTLSHVAF